MIPEEFKQDVLTDGLAFIRTITNCYGAETGMELWSQIAEVLDPDVKGQMFFAMITGNYEGTITVSDVSNSGRTNKVAMIKAIREVTGLGLKEAKDHADLMWANSPTTLVVKSEMKRNVAQRTLQLAGAVI